MSTTPNSNHETRTRNDVLPFEILGRIFLELVARDSSLSLRHVLFVSRTWYSAASQYATLWTAIRIDFALHNYFFAGGEWHMDAALYYIQCCLDRSRVMPLHVVLDLSGWQVSPRTLNTLIYRLFPLIKFLMGEQRGSGQRVRSLEWRQSHDPSFTSLVTRILPQKLPELQYLTLHCLMTGLWMLPQFPQLKRVDVFDSDDATLMIDEVGCTSVRAMRFGVSERWSPETLNCIARFRNIRELELFTVNEHARSGYSSVIELPYLTRIRTRGEIPFVFWDSLEAPLLTDIELNSYFTAEWLGETNHARKTQILRFLCPSLPQHKLGELTALQDLIASALSLETLFISQPTFNRLAANGHRLDLSYPGRFILVE